MKTESFNQLKCVTSNYLAWKSEKGSVPVTLMSFVKMNIEMNVETAQVSSVRSRSAFHWLTLSEPCTHHQCEQL